jgi:exopolysaccharide biosynthesis polyprenyl glycosylphosphotransferase
VDVCLAPDLCSYRARQDTAPLHLLHRPLAGWRGLAKRAEDILLAVGALAVAAVPMLLVALAVRLDSPGPVLFRQRRTGFNNRDFYVLKFRTMHTDQTDHEARVQVSAGDPRVTPVGAILRRTSLDELPQLLNVLWGEMSFVGPRPHAPGTRAAGRTFEEVAERYAARHRMKPGLTGLAQVRGWRGPTETEEKLLRRVEADLEYVETWSLWLDAVIILRTLVAVVRMRNAY